MSGSKKRVLVMHESARFLADVKEVVGRTAGLLTANDMATAEAAINLYKYIDVCIAEKNSSDCSSLQILTLAKNKVPSATRILIVESDAVSDAYEAIQKGIVQKYYVKPTTKDQLREALDLPFFKHGRQAELEAVLKRVNLHPPLTGGRSAISSPSLK